MNLPDLEDFYRPHQVPTSIFWADFLGAYMARNYGTTMPLDAEYFTPCASPTTDN